MSEVAWVKSVFIGCVESPGSEVKVTELVFTSCALGRGDKERAQREWGKELRYCWVDVWTSF